VSTLSRLTVLAAEAALWITGAALIAGAAGMQWSVDLPIDTNLVLTGPTPYVAPTAGPSASPAGPSLAPGASPTISPVVQAFQAFVSRADYGIKAKWTEVSTSTTGSKGALTENGTIYFKGGDHSSSSRQSQDGAVSTFDEVAVGGDSYSSVNGASWAKLTRSAEDRDYYMLLFAPTIVMADQGVETKNGAQLHRLEPADSTAFGRAYLKLAQSAIDAFWTYQIWVHDDGSPAAISLTGWTVSTDSAKYTFDYEYRIIATSGVTITAPKV
jgi:hypothetical protein